MECFSAHPLEADAAELYGPPDGYLDAKGAFHKERISPQDKAVFEIEIRPEDGVYPLPYMARQANGQAWEEECAVPGAPAEQARQGFYPDGSRSFEEIDRLSVGAAGVGNLISSFADVDFYRMLPTGGYTKGLPAAQRTDVGEGDIPPETRSKHFFAYKPFHLGESPPRPSSGAADQRRAAHTRQRQIRRRDFHPRQPAGRRDRLLAQFAARHHRADLRQLGATAARRDQQ